MAETVAFVFLGVVIIGAPELLSGVLPWSMSLVAGCALLSLLASYKVTRSNDFAAATPLAFAMCLAWVWTVVQALPLPCWFIGLLSPASVASYRAALSLLDAAMPKLCTLSRDAANTQQEIVKGVAIVSTFLSAWMFSAKYGRNSVVRLIAWSSLIMCVVALAHGALQLDEVFGLYRPVEVQRDILLAPIMNPNGLGGFALLGVPIWIGFARRERRFALRVLSHGAIVVCMATVFLTTSRGAISCLIGCLCLLIVSHYRSLRARNRPSRWSDRIGPLGAVAAVSVGLGIGVYALSDRFGDAGNRDLSKFSLIADAFKLAFQVPFVGVGRGAFSSAFARVAIGNARFVYPENFVAQWACEWGMPVALLLLAAILGALWHSFRQVAGPSREGVAIGLVALAVQNLVDLSFELVGVAVVAAAALAAVVAPQSRDKGVQVSTGQTRLPMRTLSLAFAACGLVALPGLIPKIAAQNLGTLDGELRADLQAQRRTEFWETMARALRVHPSEPVFAVLGASAALQAGDAKAPRWINRALALAPGWPTPHLQAFQWLWRSGHVGSALYELRTAAQIDPYAVRQSVCPLANADVALVVRAVPHGPAGQVVLENAASCPGLPESKVEFFDDLLVRDFDLLPARERRAVRLHRHGNTDAGLLELAYVLRRDPNRPRALLLRTELLQEAGRSSEAIQAAQHGLAFCDPPTCRALLTIEARVFGKLGDEKGLQSALDGLRGLAGGEIGLVAKNYELEGAIERDRGRLGHAYRALGVAFEMTNDPATLKEMADLALALGRHLDAVRLYNQLCRLESSDVVGACAMAKDLQLSPGR